MINFLKLAVEIFFQFIEFAIILEMLLSWITMGKDNYLMRLLHTITEPFVSPFKKIQDKIFPGFMLDFSPMFAIIFIWLIESILQRVINAL